MGLINKFLRKKYDAKNYKKFCNNANDANAYVNAYKSVFYSLDGLPIFIKDIYWITSFLVAAMNDSTILFYFDEEVKPHIDEIAQALERANMMEVKSIFDLINNNLKDLSYNEDEPISNLISTMSETQKNNILFYEKEIKRLHGVDAKLYDMMNEYFKNELNKN